jgi:hypothetical protein
VTNNGGSTGFTFTGNDSFTFYFSDTYGNTGEATAIVNYIDKTNPICGTERTPNGTARSGGDITFTISGSSDNVALDALNNYSCTVSTHGQTCNISIFDHVGNSATCTSPTALIDTTAPACGSRTYSPTTPTSGNVTATLSGSYDLESGIAIG